MKEKYVRKRAQQLIENTFHTLDFSHRTSAILSIFDDDINTAIIQTIYVKTAIAYIMKHFEEKGENYSAYYGRLSLSSEFSDDELSQDLCDMICGLNDSLADTIFSFFSKFGWDFMPIQLNETGCMDDLNLTLNFLPGEKEYLDNAFDYFSDGYSCGFLFRLTNRRLESFGNYLNRHPEHKSHKLSEAISSIATTIGIPFLYFIDSHIGMFPRQNKGSKEEHCIYSCYYSFLGYDCSMEADIYHYHMNPFSMLYAVWLDELLDLAERKFKYARNSRREGK
jgi:hypothetical protein